MEIRATDDLLVRIADLAGGMLYFAGWLESACLRRRLRKTPIEAPIFITGLARSGTTILLEELSRVEGVATHRYRDFPFVMVPYAWNRFLDRFGSPQAPVERPHKDRIQITRESPEAEEEPIWQYFFPELHADDALHRLTGERRNAAFDAFFADHLRKIVMLRRGTRYLSKGNYNFTRIEYLARLFPDARFVIPVRHPLEHVASLVRQHRLFSEYARHDPRVGRWLIAAGHYEFGPQRVPIRLSAAVGERIRRAWDRGDDAWGYAIQWADVYRFIDAFRGAAFGLAEKIHVVRHEDFCSRPHETLRDVMRHARLPEVAARDAGDFSHIAPPLQNERTLPAEAAERIWQETESVAARFGYSFDGGTASV